MGNGGRNNGGQDDGESLAVKLAVLQNRLDRIEKDVHGIIGKVWWFTGSILLMIVVTVLKFAKVISP